MVQQVQHWLETRQVPVYLAAVAAAAALALVAPRTAEFEAAINPALAFMLLVTFLQVPLADLGRAFTRWRFMAPLLAANFVAIPLLVPGLFSFCRPIR